MQVQGRGIFGQIRRWGISSESNGKIKEKEAAAGLEDKTDGSCEGAWEGLGADQRIVRRQKDIGLHFEKDKTGEGEDGWDAGDDDGLGVHGPIWCQLPACKEDGGNQGRG